MAMYKVGLQAPLEIDVQRVWDALNEQDRFDTFALGVANRVKDSHARIVYKNPKTGENIYANSDEWYAAKLEVAEEKLESLYAGQLVTATERETNPVKVEANRLAREFVNRAKKQDGAMDAIREHFGVTDDKEALKLWRAARAAKPEVIAEAEENVRKAQEQLKQIKVAPSTIAKLGL